MSSTTRRHHPHPHAERPTREMDPNVLRRMVSQNFAEGTPAGGIPVMAEAAANGAADDMTSDTTTKLPLVPLHLFMDFDLSEPTPPAPQPAKPAPLVALPAPARTPTLSRWAFVAGAALGALIGTAVGGLILML